MEAVVANSDLGEVEAGLDAALGRSTVGLSVDEVADRLIRLQQIRVKTDVLVALAAADADAAGVAANSRVRTVAHYVAAVTNADAADVRADLRVGGWLQDFPAFDQAARQGWLSRAHIRELRRVDNKRSRPHLVEGQDHLSGAARDCGFQDFLIVLAQFLIGADPDGELPKEQDANTTVTLVGNAETGSSLPWVNGGQLFCSNWFPRGLLVATGRCLSR